MATKTKKRPAQASIKDLDGADAALLKVAQASLRRKKLEADAQLKINQIKERLEADVAPLDLELEQWDEVLLEYIESHQDDLFNPEKKTVELPFGKLTSRESSKIVIKSIEKTVNLLKEHNWFDAIITKESPNKEVLAGYTPEDLKAVGAKKEVTNTLGYKVDEEKASKVQA